MHLTSTRGIWIIRIVWTLIALGIVIALGRALPLGATGVTPALIDDGQPNELRFDEARDTPVEEITRPLSYGMGDQQPHGQAFSLAPIASTTLPLSNTGITLQSTV